MHWSLTNLKANSIFQKICVAKFIFYSLLSRFNFLQQLNTITATHSIKEKNRQRNNLMDKSMLQVSYCFVTWLYEISL